MEEEKNYLSDASETSTSIEKLKTVFIQSLFFNHKSTPTSLLLAHLWQFNILIMLQMKELKIASQFY